MAYSHDSLPRLNLSDSVSIRLTSSQLLVAVAGFQLLFVLTVLVDEFLLSLGPLRVILGFASVTIVPGYLFVKLLDLNEKSVVETVLFAVGSSLTLMMILGLVVNSAFLVVGLRNPMSTWPIVGSVVLLNLLLAWGYDRRVGKAIDTHVDIERFYQPIPLFLLLLPVLSVYGAFALNAFSVNTVLLFVYLSIAGVVLLSVLGVVPRWLFPLVVWSIALSLLLQNTMTGQFLAWGDQPKEARLALSVLGSGFWNPELSGGYSNKYAMLRIVMLHPIYRLTTGLNLFWVFRLLHPIVFSLMPVALYRAYQNEVGDTTALISAFLYMSLFSFFIVLSRNTRTATAILFLALVLLLTTDRTLKARGSKLLGLLFALSIIVSHYGVSYILMFAFVGAFVSYRILDVIVHRGSVPAASKSSNNVVSSTVFISFYIVALIAWYLYIAPGGSSFGTLVNFFQEFTTRLTEQYLSSSDTVSAASQTSASARIVTQDWQSVTLFVLKLYNVFIGGLIGLGLAFVGLLTVLRRREVVTTEYLAYAGTFLAVFGVTFLPVEKFNTARTYAVCLVFFAPFLTLGVVEVTKAIHRIVGRVRQARLVQGAYALATVIVVVYFLLNVGVVSAMVTHEYSPNALIEKERITTTGNFPEQAYYYKLNPPRGHIEGSQWLLTNAEPGAEVHSSDWPGNPRGAPGHPQYRAAFSDASGVRVLGLGPNRTVNQSAYVFLGAMSYEGNTVSYTPDHFYRLYYPTTSLQDKWVNKSRVYENGEAAVYR